jgi:hypothetical protein
VCQFFFDAAAFPPVSWQFRVEGDQSVRHRRPLGELQGHQSFRPDAAVSPQPRRRGFYIDDVENVGGYRLMVKGPNRIGIQTMPQRDISVQLAR